jgi:hypothetical protein
LAAANVIYLAYKSFDGSKTDIELMTSRDSGKTWSAPRSVAETDNASDHPVLIANGKSAYLSWMSLKQGYKLIPLEPQS